MKKLLFLLIIITLISCNKSPFGDIGAGVCVVTIQYHTSSNCDDSIKEAVSFVYGHASPIIMEIESILSDREIGECVLVDLNGVFSNISEGNNLGSVYIVNDTDKSWLSIHENCIG